LHRGMNVGDSQRLDLFGEGLAWFWAFDAPLENRQTAGL